MTILVTIQDCCRELKLPVPDAVIGSTDATVVHLLALAHREGKELRSKHTWAKLTKEQTFSTVASTAAYALPTDIDYEHFQTHWDRTNHWPLRMLSPQEWQWRKSAIASTTPWSSFRIKGYATNQFYVDPTPSSVLSFVFEYQTKSWILPATWVTATTYLTGAYSSYNGIIYICTLGGISAGSTGPLGDGGLGCTWAAVTTAYERFLADTDVSQIDEDVLGLGIKWRWKRDNSFEWQSYFEEYKEAVKRAYTSQKSAPVINLFGSRTSDLIGPNSIPDTGYGT